MVTREALRSCDLAAAARADQALPPEFRNVTGNPP